MKQTENINYVEKIQSFVLNQPVHITTAVFKALKITPSKHEKTQ